MGPSRVLSDAISIAASPACRARTLFLVIFAILRETLVEVAMVVFILPSCFESVRREVECSIVFIGIYGALTSELPLYSEAGKEYSWNALP
jgi:hypothetical protein